MRRTVVLAGALLAACGSVDGGAVCSSPRSANVVYLPEPDLIDLVIVVDDSASMTARWPALTTELQRRLAALATGDRDADGLVDFAPAMSVHVAVVGADLGAGAAAGTFGCASTTGEGGAFRACASDPAPQPFVELIGAGSAAAIASVACAIGTPAAGCSVEQPIESALLALSTQSAPGGPNEGFLRRDSHLGIVVLTDEDDCSTTDPARELEGASATSTDPRCAGVALRALDRLAAGLGALRPNPALMHVVLVAGVPTHLAGFDPATILSDRAMVPTVDPSDRSRLLPSCVGPSGEPATPPVRLVELAQRLAAQGVDVSVQSICSEDLSAAFDPIAWSIADALIGQCLGPRDVGPDGRIDCELTLTLAPRDHCADLPHPDANVRLADDGIREVCLLHQVGRDEVATDVGWAYDDGATPGLPALAAGCEGNLAYVGGYAFPLGASAVLRCWDGTESVPHCR